MLWCCLHTGSEYENNYVLSDQYTRSRSMDKSHDKYHDDSNHNNAYISVVFNTPTMDVNNIRCVYICIMYR